MEPLFDSGCVRFCPDDTLRFYRRDGRQFRRVARIRILKATRPGMVELARIVTNYLECMDVPATAEAAYAVVEGACNLLDSEIRNRE